MAKKNTSEFRSADIYNEKYVQPVMDKIYELLGWSVVERVNDLDRQKRGADVILRIPNISGETVVLTMDEKLDSKRRLNADFFQFKEPIENRDKASTFCQELHMLNQGGHWQNGWFHPSVHANALNQYFVYIWINGEKDTDFTNKRGKLQKLTEIEVSVVSHSDLVERLQQDPSFEYTPAAMDALIKKIKDNVVDMNKDQRFNDNGFKYQETYPYYSGFLAEKPINLIVGKKVLRDISVCSYAFRLTGDNGNEELASFRRTKPIMSTTGKKQEQCRFSAIKYFKPEVVFTK